MIGDGARIEKPGDLRSGTDWTAYRTESGVSLRPHGHRSVELSSWGELPRALYERGLISTMEYLAQTLELEPTQPETT